MRLFSAVETDELRRLAMQLAIQLPANVADARLVLGLTEELLNKFLLEQQLSPPHRRAAALGWGLALPPVAAPSDNAGRARRCLLFSLASLLVSVPLAALLIGTVGAGAVSLFEMMIVLVALVFGRTGALVLAAVTPVIHNLLIVPPTLEFSWPTHFELLFAAYYLAIAIVVPWIAARARVIGTVAARLPLAPSLWRHRAGVGR